jgi:hypothetical protein
MVTAWSVVSILYFLGPLTFNNPPRLSTWAYIVGCVFIFLLGSREKKARSSKVSSGTSVLPLAETSARRINLVVRATALIGLLGILCITIDKVFLSGLDYSQGITALRYERHAQGAFGDENLRRSLLLYVGSFIVSFSCVAYLLYLLKAEVLSRSSIWLAQLGMVSPATLAVLSGGRSPLVMILILAFGAVIVRALSKQTPLPREPIGRRLLLVFLLLAMFYNAYVFAERRFLVGVTDYNAFEDYFEMNSAAKPSAFFEEMAKKGFISEDLTMSLLNTQYYITHSLSYLDLVIHYDGQAGPYYGEYQFSLVTTVLGRVAPSLSLNDTITSDMQDNGTLGVFTSAWAGMYLDFGRLGAFAAIFVCGWISKRVYRRAIIMQDPGAKLIMCYVTGGIILTPIISPFNPSISLTILGSILVCAKFLNFQPTRTLRRSEVQNKKHRLVLQSTVK